MATTTRSTSGTSTALVAVVAILAILALVWFFLLRGGAPGTAGGGGTDINVDLSPGGSVEAVTE